MSPKDFEKDCVRFCEYLTANGMRPVAFVMKCVGDDGHVRLVRAGIGDVVDSACLEVMCRNRGLGNFSPDLVTSND